MFSMGKSGLEFSYFQPFVNAFTCQLSSLLLAVFLLQVLTPFLKHPAYTAGQPVSIATEQVPYPHLRTSSPSEAGHLITLPCPQENHLWFKADIYPEPPPSGFLAPLVIHSSYSSGLLAWLSQPWLSSCIFDSF